jgi:flagellar operon protein
MTPVPHDPRLATPGIGRVDPAQPAQRPDTGVAPGGGTQRPGGASFADVLTRETSKVRFSSHALQRIERRGIDVGPNELARLSQGVARAAQKGARESVVFIDGTAFVVSVRNNTVITAVGREHMREHVFTNIDSAVIA